MDDYDYRDYDKERILDNMYIPLVMFLNIEPFPCEFRR